MEFIKGFLLGAFILGIIMYFVGSNNPYPAAKKRLLAKAKDVLTKVVPILAILFLTSSCGKQGKITFTEIDTLHTLRDVPVYDSAGNRLPYNAPRRDTIYTYEPSGAWKARYAWHRGDTPIAISCVLALLAVFYFFLYKPGNKGDAKPINVVVYCIAILFFLGTAGSVLDWALANTAQFIDKPVYDQVSARPGGLDSLMNARLKN